ncbi:dehydrogenase with different specificities [Microbacterium testaceum StLB037]|uniref:Dehydrogenase with different specificities n=1 Tax=Microbacterium testaceum (strain StLB037) TaxID=979556 RepID=E8N793_MICTS|nr:SDR family NAD(P)-dependent oxidoreductase [Microbacterium testaceum]BAJ75525.1 dehydrogenase with different specificities [Microbacterium testaceum StLB037]
MEHVVVITGGSRGIGRAAALRFARRRARLVLVARDTVALSSAAEECRRRGAEVLTLPMDLATADGPQRAVDATIERFGRIDVWVASASVFSYGSVEDTPDEVRDRVMETNLLGHMRAARAVLPHFRAAGLGTIVFVGSLYSQVAGPYVSSYVAAKHGLLGFSRSLRQEMLAHRGIRIKMVLPASVDTPIYQRAANYTGRTAFPLPPVVAADRVARAIVRVTRGPRNEVGVGAAQFVTRPLQFLAPRVYDLFIRVLQRVLGLRRRPAAPTPGAVLAANHDTGAVSGGWSRVPVRRPR